MFTKRLFYQLLVATLVVAIALTACAPASTQVPPPTFISPTATSIPSTPTLTTALTVTSMPISPMVVDDAAMSRLRLANLVHGSVATDMYVDGQIALLGNRQSELTKVPVGFISGFLYVEPGKHSVAIVPTGKDLSSAMIALDVTLDAGHRYTIAAIGQKDDANFTPLMIDETAALAKARTSSDQNIMTLINNVVGADTFDFLEDGVGPKNVPYGGFVTAPIKFGHVDHLVVLANGNTDLGDNPGNFDELPGIDFIHANVGRFPGVFDQSIFNYDSSAMSELNATDLLKEITAVSPVWDQGKKLSFNTFLSALDKSGLGDIISSDTYLIFAPTDEAFASMPAGQLNALMANPDELAKFLRYHIVKGYYPYGGLSSVDLENFDATVKNLLGTELIIKGDMCINQICMLGLPSITVINGTRIKPVTSVLMPPAQ